MTMVKGKAAAYFRMYFLNMIKPIFLKVCFFFSFIISVRFEICFSHNYCINFLLFNIHKYAII